LAAVSLHYGYCIFLEEDYQIPYSQKKMLTDYLFSPSKLINFDITSKTLSDKQTHTKAFSVIYCIVIDNI
ncbi:MAG: hypothetical protein H6Q69_4241, partial [Firmicutes bacterium]|nr:hypothetical protein [Bacillota bacterium]